MPVNDAVAVELSAMKEMWERHTLQDMEQFTALKNSIDILDDKIDQLLLREARREGEAAGTRKMAAIVSATISILIGIATVAAAVML